MPDSVRRRVAVTGLGAICALGGDAPAFWSGLQAGQSGIGPISAISTNRLSASIAAEVAGFDGTAHFDSRRLTSLDRTAQLAVVAAREAIQSADLAPDPAHAHRRGVVLAAAIGQSSLDAAYLAFYGEGASRVHPLTVPRVMPNAPASHVSMEFGLRGPSYAVASACASANHAIGLAADTIRAGRADVMLTGGADASPGCGRVQVLGGAACAQCRHLPPVLPRPQRAGARRGRGGAGAGGLGVRKTARRGGAGRACRKWDVRRWPRHHRAGS